MSHTLASLSARVRRLRRRTVSGPNLAGLSHADRRAAEEFAQMTGMYRPISDRAAAANARPVPRAVKYVGPPRG